ncbi:MAG TPA: ATPase P [Syntrophomonas sp.]|nr:ATPase P [Syntrophomonas sp.]
MLEVDIPGRGLLKLTHLLLDVNGTLTVDGILIPGVKERVELLKDLLSIHLLTADTFGRGVAVASELRTRFKRVDSTQGGLDKKDYLYKLGRGNTAAIGNGYNDIYMLQDAALGIAVINNEGCAAEAIRRADILVNNVVDALDLLINRNRLIATLRA